MGGLVDLWHKHPYAVAAGVFVIGLIVVYFVFGGSSSASSSNDDAASYYAAQAAITASGNQLAATQLAAQTQITGFNDQLQANAQQVQGTVQLTQINSDAATQQASIAAGANVQQTQIATTGATQQLQIATTGATQQAQINAGVSKVSIAANQESTDLQNTLQAGVTTTADTLSAALQQHALSSADLENSYNYNVQQHILSSADLLGFATGGNVSQTINTPQFSTTVVASPR